MKRIYSFFAASQARLLLLLALGLIPATGQAQAPTWRLAMSLGGSPGGSLPEAFPTATVVNAAGDVYVVGNFVGSIAFGGTTITSLGSRVSTDVFIAKWSHTTNSFVWAQRLGSLTNDAVVALTVGQGGVYLAGTCGSAATFGGITLAESGPFLARFTDTGTAASIDWAQHLEVGGLTSLAVDGASIYTVGKFSGTISFGGQTLTSAGPQTGYLTRLTDTGTGATPGWIRSVGTNAMGLAASGGSVYVGGSFSGQTTFGATTLTSNASGGSGFIAKLTDSGSVPSFEWVQKMDGPYITEAHAIAVSGADVYVAGNFRQRGSYGSITLSSANTMVDGFVAKLADAGASSSFVWAAAMNNGFSDNVWNMVVQGPGVYVAGDSGRGNSFVGRFTDNGASVTRDWMDFTSESIYSPIVALAANSYGQVYLGGNFVAPARFGSVLVAPNVPFGNNLGFWAFLQDNTVTATAPAATALPLAFYPNPARTLVQVPAATAATVLTLLDGLGRTIRTATGAALSVRGLAPGLYVLRAATPGQRARTGRLVVE